MLLAERVANQKQPPRAMRPLSILQFPRGAHDRLEARGRRNQRAHVLVAFREVGEGHFLFQSTLPRREEGHGRLRRGREWRGWALREECVEARSRIKAALKLRVKTTWCGWATHVVCAWVTGRCTHLVCRERAFDHAWVLRHRVPVGKGTRIDAAFAVLAQCSVRAPHESLW